MADIRRSTGRSGLFAALAALALAAAACGGEGAGHSGCGEYCERIAVCPDAGEDAEATCESTCAEQQEGAEKAGCERELEEHVECFGHAMQVCDAVALESECAISGAAFTECVQR